MSYTNLDQKDSFADTGGDNIRYTNFDQKDLFAETGEKSELHESKIHIRIQQRNGRKTLTTVQGLADDYNLKKILKTFRSEFSTNGNIVAHETLGEVIQLQGDQRAKVSEFIIGELKIDRKVIKIHGF